MTDSRSCTLPTANLLLIAYGSTLPRSRINAPDDQQLFGQSYAERCRLEVIAFYGDDGITGAAIERPGLEQVLELITKGQVRNLISEGVARLSCDAEHLHCMVKLFRLHQVAVHTVVAGKVDDLVLAFKGIVGEQQRMRIAYTTRCGLRGKATRGGATGGRVLGYRREITGEDAQGRELD